MAKQLYSLFILLIIILGAVCLRLPDLSVLPNGLHWDEMDTGLQAKSLFYTGRDYFGEFALLSVHSFADFRGPIFIYSAVPFVAPLGLSALSVRLPAFTWSIVSILAIYVLAQLIFSDQRKKVFGLNIGHFAALSLSLSPWHVQYSRQSVETISATTLFLVGLAYLLRATKRPYLLVISALLLALSTAAYAPMKLIVPAILFFVVIFYRRILFKLPMRIIILSCLVFLTVFTPLFLDGSLGRSSLRTKQLSVFTDPTTSETVKDARELQQISSGSPKTVGMAPRLIDKLVYNKPTLWLTSVVNNYLSAFSTDFLFIKGDKELRHSPNKDGYGMLMFSEALVLVIGISVLSRRLHLPQYQTLLLWLLIAPLSGSLTRWDNPHAARLFVFLPALILTITIGTYSLARKTKLIFFPYLLLLIFTTVTTYAYFFSNYRFESAGPFQYGQTQIMSYAISQKDKYQNIVLDFNSDNPLMAYLYTSNINPRLLQSLQPLDSKAHFVNSSAFQFDSIYLLPAGHRAWEDYLSAKQIPAKTLVIVSANQPSASKMGQPLYTLNYPDGQPAFFAFSY